MMRLIPVVVLAAALSLTAGLGAASAATDRAQAQVKSITVSGSGRVSTVPDRAELSFGVTTQARTASAAMRENAAAMTKVIAALKDAGVAAADIQTQFVEVSPRTNDNGDAIVGYTASNSVSASVRTLANVGAVIDAGVEAGANTVSGPNLTRSDSASLYLRALRAAIADARAKAQAIAAASHVKLGRVVMVVEGSSSPVPFTADKAANAPASTPVEPGTQFIVAAVTVTFAVR
jgi:uncharacterized protein YggE